MEKVPQRYSEGKRHHPQRINVPVNCKLLIFSPHFHNFQITVSNNKRPDTAQARRHCLWDIRGSLVQFPSGSVEAREDTLDYQWIGTFCLLSRELWINPQSIKPLRTKRPRCGINLGMTTYNCDMSKSLHFCNPLANEKFITTPALPNTQVFVRLKGNKGYKLVLWATEHCPDAWNLTLP